MIVYLTEVYGGRAMLTAEKPVIQLIKYTNIMDAFSLPGEPLDVRHMCQPGVRLLLNSKASGMVLAPLTPTLVRINCHVLEKDKLVPLCHDAALLI